MTENNKNLGIDGFDPSKVNKLSAKEILKRVGPGIVLTGVVIGPGNITTSAMIGANYGYSLIWLIIPILIMGVTFMLTSYRISMLTGMPILHAIRHYYGKVASGFCGVALFLSCLFFTLGNISGTGAGMNLVFGINWKLGALIMLAVLTVLYFSKGVYSKVAMGHGLTHWSVPEGSLTTALAYISTNAAVTAGIYGTYLGAEKKWKKEDLFNGAMKWDAIAHIVSVILISGAIMLVGAIVLNPQGIQIKAPAQLAALLVPFLGKASNIVMGVALLGAGFSSLLGNTQRGMVLLSAGFDKDVALESKLIRWGCMITLAFACVVCFIYDGSPTQLIFIANIATSIATPVAGLFITLMFWKKEVQAGLKAPRVLQVLMTVSYLFTLAMTVSALANYIPKLIASFS